MTADDEVDDSDLTLAITVVAVVDVDLRQVSSLTHFFFSQDKAFQPSTEAATPDGALIDHPRLG